MVERGGLTSQPVLSTPQGVVFNKKGLYKEAPPEAHLLTILLPFLTEKVLHTLGVVFNNKGFYREAPPEIHLLKLAILLPFLTEKVLHTPGVVFNNKGLYREAPP